MCVYKSIYVYIYTHCIQIYTFKYIENTLEEYIVDSSDDHWDGKCRMRNDELSHCALYTLKMFSRLQQ
jgi:hypothetical protein